MKIITIGYITQTYWFFNMTREQAISKWLELEEETEIPHHISVEEEEIKDNYAVTYATPY